jgi:L-ascorbate oxidase
MWHGHDGATRMDGLQGPLVVRPGRGFSAPVITPHDAEHVVFIADHYHALGAPSMAALNRPFAGTPGAGDPENGGFAWIGNPQSVLINGRANASDCAPGNATAPATCAVAALGEPGAAGCGHAVFDVRPGGEYLFRVINAGSLTYQTVCFEGHNATVVAADARPVAPLSAGPCVDVNVGQRLDVLLKADADPGRSYWLSSAIQYRPGGVSGYGVIRYLPAPAALPPTRAPPPGSVAPWTPAEAGRLRSHPVLGAPRPAGAGPSAGDYGAPPEPTLRLAINLTQPLLRETGQVRWALNNVAGATAPPCQSVLGLLTS